MMRIGGSVRPVKRCHWCGRLIWPWQQQTVLYTLPVPSERRFHEKCWQAHLQEQQERQWRQEQML